jgi:hypothetical protein
MSRRASATGARTVDEYLEFSRLDRASVAPEMGPDHAYNAEGMRKLSGALEALTEGRDRGRPNENRDRLRGAIDKRPALDCRIA